MISGFRSKQKTACWGSKQRSTMKSNKISLQRMLSTLKLKQTGCKSPVSMSSMTIISLVIATPTRWSTNKRKRLKAQTTTKKRWSSKSCLTILLSKRTHWKCSAKRRCKRRWSQKSWRFSCRKWKRPRSRSLLRRWLTFWGLILISIWLLLAFRIITNHVETMDWIKWKKKRTS